MKGLTHKQQVKRWLKGFYAAKEAGDQIGFTVLPGAEVRFDGYPNDYLVYGLNEDFFYTAPRLNELKSIDALLAILPLDVCVVQTHPFRDGMEVVNPKGLFALEVYIGGTEKFRNEMAKQFAIHYEMPMTSGSDIHGIDRLAKDFLDNTGIDALAIAIGTAHGTYTCTPKLDMERLKAIRNTIDTPLVLHGGSGLTTAELGDCIANGITKVNIFTDLYVAGKAAMADLTGDYHDIRARRVQAIQNVVMDKIILFGSNGRA